MASQPKSELRAALFLDGSRKRGGALPTAANAAAQPSQGLKPIGLSFAAVLERARPQ